MDIGAALTAICSAGGGHCWYCNHQVPAADEAIASGWDVQRIAEERVASIILVCPTCLRQKSELDEEGFPRLLSQRFLNTPH
jgi:hypothetical protein